MPRKRRNKKDPLAKKIDFDKEPDVPSKIVNACGPNGISPSENDQEVFGPEADAALPTASSDPPSNAENVPTDFSHRDRWRFGRSYGVTAEEADGGDSSRGFLVVLSTFVCLFFLIMLVQWIKTEGTAAKCFVIIFYNVMSNFMNFKEKSERKAVLTKGVGIDLLLELYEVVPLSSPETIAELGRCSIYLSIYLLCFSRKH